MTRLTGDATDVVVVAAFLASVLFVVVYTVLAAWWRTPVGRALVAMDTGLALTLAPLSAHLLLGLTLAASAGFAWYYLGSLGLVACSTLWRTWIVWRAQRPPPGGPLPAEAAGAEHVS